MENSLSNSVNYLIKNGYKHEEYKGYHILTNTAKLCLAVFKGRNKNKTFHYRYRSIEEINAKIAKFKQRTLELEEEKIAYKLEKKKRLEEQLKNIKIGDIYVASWGYEQTNLDFYQVVGKKGKCTFELREIKTEQVEHMATCSMSAYVKPVKDSFIKEDIQVKRLNVHGFTIDRVRSAYKWEGEPCYTSWYY